jgi:pimeloyl-ACP methyl ester carboxylesterase
MKIRHVDIHGKKIAFCTGGDGPVVLLVHGMAGSFGQWRHVFDRLAERFTVVAPDLLGHGQSDKPAAEYNLSAHANVLRDLLVALGHERATLVGQSYGGGVVMQLAYQSPEHCERLVLVSSGGLGPEVAPLLRGLSLPGAEQLLALACARPLRDAGERLAQLLSRFNVRTTPVVEEMWRSYAALGDPATRRAFLRTLRAVVSHRGQTVSAADRLYLTEHVPTLVVWGSADNIIPVSHAYDAQRYLPESRLEIFEGVGHYPHCERPEQFARTVIDFMASTEGARLSTRTFSELLREQTRAEQRGAA